MQKLILVLLALPLIGFGQANYNITVSTPNAWQANIFTKLGYERVGF